MRNRAALFTSIVVIAVLSAFLVYEPTRVAPIRAQVSRAVAALPPVVVHPLAPIIEKFIPPVSVPAPAVAAPGTPARIVRVPAIHEAQNYGWIQLPRGTRVDLVEEQRDGFLIRYDESFVVIPRAAVDDGTIVLREKRSDPAS